MEKMDDFVSDTKVQKIVGDGLSEVHDILDDAIGRLNKIEEEKSESDEAILKEMFIYTLFFNRNQRGINDLNIKK